MEYTKEQILLIHNICWREINMLKKNLDKFIQDSERCQKLLAELSATDEVDNIFDLVVFDRYMTQMVTALSMASKFNIHLDINSLEQTVIKTSTDYLEDTYITQARMLKDFIEWKKTFFGNDIGFLSVINTCAGRIKMTLPISEIVEDDDVFNYATNRMKLLALNKNDGITWLNDKSTKISNKSDILNILLPKKDLSDFKTGFEFEAYVVYVRDYRRLEFFVCLKEDFNTLYDLSRNINSRPISNEFLPANEIFCVLDKRNTISRQCQLRAVIVPDEGHDKVQKFIYLIDFGEVIQLTDHCEIFEAPLHFKQIPPLAIKCMLAGVDDSFLKFITDDRDKCKRSLQDHEFKKAHFRILHQKNQLLTVILLEIRRTIKSAPALDTSCLKNPFLNTTFRENDDQNCSTNSAALQLPRSFVYEEPCSIKPVLNITSKVGDKIQVIVTHISSPISFYGIVQNNSDYADHKTFSWHDHQIFSYQKQMAQPPRMADIVLAQYVKDGYWYRGKVINTDSQNNLYKVFYVDFGNTEVVPLGALAKCSKEQLEDPLRAVLFHLCNLSIITQEGNVDSLDSVRLSSAIENMVVMILEQTINVEIINRRNDDLVVRLIDTQYDHIPKMLIDMGVVKEI